MARLATLARFDTNLTFDAISNRTALNHAICNFAKSLSANAPIFIITTSWWCESAPKS